MLAAEEREVSSRGRLDLLLERRVLRTDHLHAGV